MYVSSMLLQMRVVVRAHHGMLSRETYEGSRVADRVPLNLGVTG